MKYATPLTIVPGATKDIDEDTLLQKRDKKGRPLWIMPKPVGTHKVTQVDKRGRREVEVPVYRGVSASLWRYLRSQWRYQQKLALRKRQQEMLAENAMQDEILKGAT